MKIAALQMVSGIQLQANLAQARQLMEQAASLGPSWWCCPNISAPWAPGTRTRLPIAKPSAWGPSKTSWRAARELRLWVVAGTLPLQADDAQHVLNTSLVYSPQGDCVARYDKIHLFRFDNGREHYAESDVVSRCAARGLRYQGQKW